MKKFFAIVVLVTGTLLLSGTGGFAAPAPQGVDEIFEAMEELETNYENYRWEEALAAAEKIRNELREIFAQGKLADPALEERVAELVQSVQRKGHDETEVNFIRFQKQFFIFISQYDYDVHPVLKIIEEYIFDEAAEAAAKNEYAEVESEMVEVGNLIDPARRFLLDKGVSEEDITAFKLEVINLIKAARKKDANEVDASLKKVMEKYKTFMKKVQQS